MPTWHGVELEGKRDQGRSGAEPHRCLRLPSSQLQPHRHLQSAGSEAYAGADLLPCSTLHACPLSRCGASSLTPSSTGPRASIQQALPAGSGSGRTLRAGDGTPGQGLSGSSAAWHGSGRALRGSKGKEAGRALGSVECAHTWECWRLP